MCVCVCMYEYVCEMIWVRKENIYCTYLYVLYLITLVSRVDCECMNMIVTTCYFLSHFDIQVDFVPSNTHQGIYKYVYVRCTRMGWVFENIWSNGSCLILRLKFLCVRSRLMDGKFSGHFCLYQRFTVWKHDFRMF